jgi:hypothetical protein
MERVVPARDRLRPRRDNTAFATRNSAVGVDGPVGRPLRRTLGFCFRASPRPESSIPSATRDCPTSPAPALQQGNFARRQSNAVQYWSRPWAGLRVKLGYATLEDKGQHADPHDLGVALTYLGR